MCLDWRDLNSQNTKNDEEGAADEDDVSDRFERREKSLDHELQPGSSVNNPERFQGSDESEDSQHPEYFAFLADYGGYGGVHQ